MQVVSNYRVQVEIKALHNPQLVLAYFFLVYEWLHINNPLLKTSNEM